MNPKYYVDDTELKRVTDFLNANGIGGGVKFTHPLEWVGPFKIPAIPGKTPAQIVLDSGAELNAGLVLDLLSKGYPEWFVASTLRAQAQGA